MGKRLSAFKIITFLHTLIKINVILIKICVLTLSKVNLMMAVKGFRLENKC